MSQLPQPYSRPRSRAGREIAGHRDGVDVPGQHHPLGPAEPGARDHRVAVAVHGECGSPRSAASITSASGPSEPLTDSMSTSRAVRSGAARERSRITAAA